MEVMPKFVSMAISPEERKDDAPEVSPETPALPVYPYGLSICLGNDELEKLDLDADVEPGDMVHLFCMAKVTSVSKNDTTEGAKMRVEMQITDIAVESEDDENEEAEKSMPAASINSMVRKAYGK